MKKRSRPSVESLEERTLLNAGDLDLTFAGTGKVLTQITTQSNESYATAVQPDGKTVVAGYVSEIIHNTSVRELGLVRYNVDGSLDPTFGSGGKAKLAASEWSFTVPEGLRLVMAMQGDGKFVVAIAATPKRNSSVAWEVLRFTATGALDTTFGAGTGKVVTDLTAYKDVPDAIAIQGDGKIVVAGNAGTATSSISNFAAVRYTSGGALDTTFGSGGQVITSFGAGLSGTVRNMAIDTSGRILVAGALQPAGSSNSQAALVRYTPSGGLDTTFGSGGEVFITVPGFAGVQGTGVGLQSTGKVLFSLIPYSPSDPNAPLEQLAVARFNADGSPDDGSPADSTPADSFGIGGFYVESRMSLNSTTSGGPVGTWMVVQPDDKVILTGLGRDANQSGTLAPDPDYSDYWVTRVLADGSSYDPNYGVSGLGHANIGVSGVRPFSMALGPDGKVVVTGSYSGTSPGGFSTARFQGDPTTILLAFQTRRVVPAATTRDPLLVPLVPDVPHFLDAQPMGKRRRA